MNPDPYRGVFGSEGEKYAKDVQDLIDFGTSGNVAAFISEAIQVNHLSPKLFIPSQIWTLFIVLLNLISMYNRVWGGL